VENIGVSIVNALNDAVKLILTFIPRIVGFIVILVVGLIIATLVSKALTLVLRKVGFDRMANRIGLTRFEQRMNVKLDPAGVLGKIVYWFILLIFLIPAADALGVPAVSNILNSLVAYIPNVFVAILVLFLGSLAGTFVADIVRGTVATAKIGNPNVFASIARWAVIGFAALIALEQLQIAPALINELFGAVVAAVAIAFALAFGLGGQDAARRWLARGESTVTTAAAQVNAQQIRDSAQNGMRQAEQARLQQQAQAQTYQQTQAQPYQQPAQPYQQPPVQPYQQSAQPYVSPADETTVDPTTYNQRNSL
jgi:mechanosensitive ion channel-like protein